MKQEDKRPLLIGGKIKGVRERRGLKQKSVAAMAKISPHALSRLENGFRDEVKLKTVLAIMRVLSMDLEMLREDMNAMNVDTVDVWPLG